MNKKIKLFCSIFLSVMLFSCSINASASNTSVITTSDILSLLNNMALPSSLFTLGHKAILSLLITMILKQFYLMPKRTCHGNQ